MLGDDWEVDISDHQESHSHTLSYIEELCPTNVLQLVARDWLHLAACSMQYPPVRGHGGEKEQLADW